MSLSSDGTSSDFALASCLCEVYFECGSDSSFAEEEHLHLRQRRFASLSQEQNWFPAA